VPQRLRAGAAHRESGAVRQLRRHPAFPFPPEEAHVIQVHDVGPVDADEPRGVEPCLDPFARWLGLVILVPIGATAWPAVRALRIPTATALAYE